MSSKQILSEIVKGIKEGKFEVNKLIDAEVDKLFRLPFSEYLKTAFIHCERVPLEYTPKNDELVVDEVGFVDYKNNLVTRLNPLKVISSAIILVKASFTVVYKDYRGGVAVLATKREMVSNLLNKKKELENTLRKTKSKRLIEAIKNEISKINQAIEWLTEV